MHKGIVVGGILLAIGACKAPQTTIRDENRGVPGKYSYTSDTTNAARIKWQDFFPDQNLRNLIDTALLNNQELNITLQEIAVSQNEVLARQGEYRPFVGVRGGAGVDKVGRYTNIGALEKNIDIAPDRETPEPLPDFLISAFATWEVDIWHKLRNAKQAAVNRYLASVEGRNFMVTNLIAEIATSYYELLALDNQLAIVRQNIEVQNNVLSIIRQEKEAAKVTELAVRRFEAQVLNTQSIQFDLQQRIIETENRINFLVGRYPQPVARNAAAFNGTGLPTVTTGLPSQLLANRPDIRQAELNLIAAKLDVKSAQANFYPSLRLSAALGLNAFTPGYLFNPASMLSSLAGDLVGPIVNKNGIRATYNTATAKQLQAVYQYERTVLNAFTEVTNQLSRIDNLGKSYERKEKEVQALTQSISISNSLFRSARADYMEVLLTQRDAQESRLQLVETRMQQLTATVAVYRALGGGWN
ncbi:RND efflux system, outer membrane lipoprotein,NodT family [Fibrella aestuarina BUZ 2]|uniref:RND efflux system, outer membrane lipoprotein,NodT family n=1 Tax=Fibrella aestuarina BUZ 2 TaxID=1166018 RepID=I0KEB9_9BACT|nr:efflux transporter outer membrane subunit [Fibrella aestuarina]CCH02472.1 RND efflux system, outer membrane lipoprotein,NodT family [Fibrella aestuarina BUZ 2]